MKERDCRTIAIEVGLQNAGLGSSLALAMGKLATVGLAPAVFAPIMNVTGSSLALWWRARPLPDGDLQHEPQQDKKIERAKT
jgi:bile acid:Na+ symporter, BASS family